MMTDLFWDEVLLTNNPDSKELEVSFKKIDGDGFLTSAGGQPGAPGGIEEDPSGDNNGLDDDGDGVNNGVDNDGDGEVDENNNTPTDTVPPAVPPPECEPGIDCSGFTSLVVNSGSRAGVFGLYDSAKQISQPIVTSLGTIYALEKGDGELSGWAKLNSGAYSARSASLEAYLLDQDESVCAPSAELYSGFPPDIFVASEFISGGCEIVPLNREDSVSYKHHAEFVVFLDPITTVGQYTTSSFTSTLTATAGYSAETQYTTISHSGTTSVSFVGQGAGNPHNVVVNGAVVGSYDFNVPGAKLMSVSLLGELSAEWKTDHDESSDDYLDMKAQGIVICAGTGGGASGGTNKTTRYQGGYPYYGTSDGNGFSRGVPRYNPAGVILSGGAGGDDIFLAVQKTVSTYQTPDYCARIP